MNNLQKYATQSRAYHTTINLSWDNFDKIKSVLNDLKITEYLLVGENTDKFDRPTKEHFHLWHLNDMVPNSKTKSVSSHMNHEIYNAFPSIKPKGRGGVRNVKTVKVKEFFQFLYLFKTWSGSTPWVCTISQIIKPSKLKELCLEEYKHKKSRYGNFYLTLIYKYDTSQLSNCTLDQFKEIITQEIMEYLLKDYSITRNPSQLKNYFYYPLSVLRPKDWRKIFKWQFFTEYV